MIPPRNSLAVGGVATCAVASPQYQRSTRPCDSNLHDSALRGSLSGELPKYTARSWGENELLHGVSFPGTCTVLLPSSLLREAVPVLYTSLTGHSHLCTSPIWNKAERWASKDKMPSSARPLFTSKKHYEHSLVNPTYAGSSCPLHLDSPLYYWHVTSVFHCFFECDIIALPDVGSWPDVMTYKWFHPDSHLLHICEKTHGALFASTEYFKSIF